MSRIKAYISKSLIFADQAVVSGTNFLIGIALVRLFGIQAFGDYAIIMMIVLGLISLNQGLVLSPYQSLFAHQDYKRYKQEVKTMQLTLLLVVVVLWSLVCLISRFYDVSFLSLIELKILPFLIGSILLDFNRKKLILENRYQELLFKDVLVTIAQVVPLALFFWEVLTLDMADYLLVSGGGMLLVELIFFVKGLKMLYLSVTTIKEHLSFGGWLVGNAVLQWFAGNLFIITGASILGNEVAGVIRMGQSAIGFWNVLIQVFENFIPPKAAIVYRDLGWIGVRKYLLRITVIGLVPLSLAAICMFFFKDLIWELMYGVDTIAFSFVLGWFALILIVNFLGFPLRFALRTVKDTRTMFEAYAMVVALSFAIVTPLVNAWGIHGVCVGLLGSQIIMQVWYMFKLFKIDAYESGAFNIG